ncbi:MAG TPA: molybdate ABC transporter substrate-binding protein [Gaiellales bacterium]|jgi:molybdate transport system substrate-binding protein|nr:molybdate ABC transporter substrate-binding protein [Gaiellales bacterium]
MRTLRAVALAAATLAATACGGGSSGGGTGSTASGGMLNVFAASSLTGAFTQLQAVFQKQHPGWTVKLNFAGSDQLAAQIEQGAPADVFAAASTKYPEELQAKKLLGTTTDFATNSLILAVPASNPAHIRSVRDLTNGAKLVVGDPAVPLGAYTETVLANLGISDSQLNIVSREQDAKSVLAKITLGETDAGFVYVTDALSAGNRVKQIALPASAQATATYPIGVVSSSTNTKAAQQWIDLVTGPEGQKVLKDLAFGPPPST